MENENLENSDDETDAFSINSNTYVPGAVGGDEYEPAPPQAPAFGNPAPPQAPAFGNPAPPQAPAFGNPSIPLSDDGSVPINTPGLGRELGFDDAMEEPDPVDPEDEFAPFIEEIIQSFQEEGEVASRTFVSQNGANQIAKHFKRRTFKTLKKGTLVYCLRNASDSDFISGNMFAAYDPKGVFFTSMRELVYRKKGPISDSEVQIDTYRLTTNIDVHTNFLQDKNADVDIIYPELLMSASEQDAPMLTNFFGLYEQNEISATDLAHLLFGFENYDIRDQLVAEGGRLDRPFYRRTGILPPFIHKYAGKFNRYVPVPRLGTDLEIQERLVGDPDYIERGNILYLTDVVYKDGYNEGKREHPSIRFVGTSNINNIAREYMELYIYLNGLSTLEDINNAYSFNQHEFLRFTLFESRKTLILAFQLIIEDIKWVKTQDPYEIVAFWQYDMAKDYYTRLIETLLDFLYINSQVPDPVMGEAYMAIYNPEADVYDRYNLPLPMDGYERWIDAFPDLSACPDKETSDALCTSVVEKLNEKIEKLRALESIDKIYEMYQKPEWTEEDMKYLATYFTRNPPSKIFPANYVYTLPSIYIQKKKDLLGPGPTAISDNGEFLNDNNVDYSMVTGIDVLAEKIWDLYGTEDEQPKLIQLSSQQPVIVNKTPYITSINEFINQGMPGMARPNIFNANFKITMNFNSIYKNKSDFMNDKYPCSPGTKMCNQNVLEFRPPPGAPPGGLKYLDMDLLPRKIVDFPAAEYLADFPYKFSNPQPAPQQTQSPAPAPEILFASQDQVTDFINSEVGFSEFMDRTDNFLNLFRSDNESVRDFVMGQIPYNDIAELILFTARAGIRGLSYMPDEPLVRVNATLIASVAAVAALVSGNARLENLVDLAIRRWQREITGSESPSLMLSEDQYRSVFRGSIRNNLTGLASMGLLDSTLPGNPGTGAADDGLSAGPGAGGGGGGGLGADPPAGAGDNGLGADPPAGAADYGLGADPPPQETEIIMQSVDDLPLGNNEVYRNTREENLERIISGELPEDVNPELTETILLVADHASQIPREEWTDPALIASVAAVASLVAGDGEIEDLVDLAIIRWEHENNLAGGPGANLPLSEAQTLEYFENAINSVLDEDDDLGSEPPYTTAGALASTTMPSIKKSKRKSPKRKKSKRKSPKRKKSKRKSPKRKKSKRKSPKKKKSKRKSPKKKKSKQKSPKRKNSKQKSPKKSKRRYKPLK